jgi:hypothetical protein
MARRSPTGLFVVFVQKIALQSRVISGADRADGYVAAGVDVKPASWVGDASIQPIALSPAFTAGRTDGVHGLRGDSQPAFLCAKGDGVVASCVSEALTS